MKEEYRAQKKPSTSDGAGKGRGKVGQDGIIESDSDDERVPKRKAEAAPSVDGPIKNEKEIEVGVKEGDREAMTKSAKKKVETKTPIKHKPSKA